MPIPPRLILAAGVLALVPWAAQAQSVSGLLHAAMPMAPAAAQELVWPAENHTTDEGEVNTHTGAPNPAAVFCVNMGGDYQIRSGAKGEYGVCIFPDGREEDAWDFFREEFGDHVPSSDVRHFASLPFDADPG
ncbi:MAG: DUF333 domain-containing protein [Pseudomonadota bacterium]